MVPGAGKCVNCIQTKKTESEVEVVSWRKIRILLLEEEQMRVVQLVKSNICALCLCSLRPSSLCQSLSEVCGDPWRFLKTVHELLCSCQELPSAGGHLLGIARISYLVQLLLCRRSTLSVCSWASTKQCCKNIGGLLVPAFCFGCGKVKKCPLSFLWQSLLEGLQNTVFWPHTFRDIFSEPSLSVFINLLLIN